MIKWCGPQKPSDLTSHHSHDFLWPKFFSIWQPNDKAERNTPCSLLLQKPLVPVKILVSFYHKKNKITQALFPYSVWIYWCPSCAGFYAESIIYYGFKFFCSCLSYCICIEYMHHIITKIFMFVAISAVACNNLLIVYTLKNVIFHSICLSFSKANFLILTLIELFYLYFEVFLVVPSILKKCLGIYHNLILVVTYLIIFYVQNFQILK